MWFYEIINKKKRGDALTGEEIRKVVTGYGTGEVQDYQMSALLMAIYFQGMSSEETAALTMAMVDSGESVDLTPLGNITVDKHSTGGVGDKTTLAVVPIVAACGVPLAKMSGRGLGHTGGTIDKLEAIPGFRTTLSGTEFMQIVQKHGLCIAGQSTNLAPADKSLYALRDVTATVDSIPLIAASIMSKKIAAGADAILLDVKTGSGAFMKTLKDARALARAMVDIGKNCGRQTAALITDMSAPLGRAIGNSLELIEVIDLLSGKLNNAPVSKNLLTLCEELSANMLLLAKKGDLDECRSQVKNAISSGNALQKLADMVEAQGGDRSYIKNPSRFIEAEYITEVPSPQDGYISVTDTEGIGIAAMTLGAGRAHSEDKIDYSSGIILTTAPGEQIKKGQTLAILHTSAKPLAITATEKFLRSLTFAQTPQPQPPLIHEQVN